MRIMTARFCVLSKSETKFLWKLHLSRFSRMAEHCLDIFKVQNAVFFHESQNHYHLLLNRLLIGSNLGFPTLTTFIEKSTWL